MDDPDLDPIDETAKPVLSDSELSDVDEEAFAGVDTNNIGIVVSDDEAGPNVFSLKPSKLKSGSGERKKLKVDESAEERRRKRQERQEKRLEKEEARRRRQSPDQVPDDLPDANRRPDDPELARKWDLNQAMDAAILKKPSKRRKRNDDVVELDDPETKKVKLLKEQMDQAAEQDYNAIANSMPATHKLGLLPAVEAILSKSNLHEAVLDNFILIAMRRWLEPLPDRSLPAYSIQRVLLSALQKLPVTKESLAESGIGKIVMFYRNSPRVEPSIRKIADSLWVEWSRPILRKSANYRDKQVAKAAYNPSMALPVFKNAGGEDPKRTVIPRQIHSTFDIAPQTKIDRSNVQTARAVKVENTEMFKRLKMRMQIGSGKSKKENGVRIQGGAR